MAISCNNDKENMMTKKFVMQLPIKEHNKQCKHYETHNPNKEF